eukprot:2666144-Rhodomonas_salina.1
MSATTSAPKSVTMVMMNSDFAPDFASALVEEELSRLHKGSVDELPAAVRQTAVPYSMPIAFWWGQKWQRGVSTGLFLPNGRDDMSSVGSQDDFEFYSKVEPANEHRFSTDWLADQASFFQTLTDDDLLTLMTYSYRGDQMINDFLMFGRPKNLDLQVHQRVAGWYLSGPIGGHGDYVLFEPQIR